MDNFRFLYQLMRPYWRRYGLGILLVPFSTGLALSIPRLTGKAVNLLKEIAGHGEASLRPVLVLGAAILVVAVGRGLCLFGVRMLIIGASRGFEFDLRNRLFDHLQSLDLKFFQRSRTGDIMNRLTSDVDAARTLAGPVVMYTANALLTLTLAIPLMVLVDPLLTVLVMVPLSLLTLAVRRIGPRVHAASRRAQETLSSLSSFAQENFGGVRVVKSYAREDDETAAFASLADQHLMRTLEAERIYSWMGPIAGSIGELAVILLLLVGGRIILAGTFTLGQFMEFAGYQTLLIWPMISIGWVLNQAHRGTASAVRLREILAARSEVIDLASGDSTGPAVGPAAGVGGPAAPAVFAPHEACEVEVRDLDFSYHDRQVLRGIHLRAAKGSTIAVIGRTGSGKSTLLGLIARLYPVPDGKIFIDGRDVNHSSLRDLRRAIGFVPQESFLFSRTIAENIAFSADGEMDPREVEASARRFAAMARLDKDIDQFPRGYGEMVGERGVTLSGGQKQRAAIARALMADPRILILDDPLSAVDTHTEEEILVNLREAARGRTMILASHRIAGIRLADRIHVLEEGRIVESGTHRELLKLGGVYAELHRRQLLEEELERL